MASTHLDDLQYAQAVGDLEHGLSCQRGEAPAQCHPVPPNGEPSPANKSSLVAEMRRFSISSISAYSTPSVNSTLNEAGRYFTVTFLSLFQFLVLFQVEEETR